MASVSTHPMTLDEHLDKINSSTDVVSAIRLACKEPYVKFYLELAVSEKWTNLDLDEVIYTKYDYPKSLAGAFLLSKQTTKIIDQVIMVDRLPDRSKANQYKALKEMLCAEESALLTLVLTKNIQSVYDRISFESIVEGVYGNE